MPEYRIKKGRHKGRVMTLARGQNTCSISEPVGEYDFKTLPETQEMKTYFYKLKPYANYYEDTGREVPCTRRYLLEEIE